VAVLTCPGFEAVGFLPFPPNSEQEDRATDPPMTKNRTLNEYFILIFSLNQMLIKWIIVCFPSGDKFIH
jgi:hypothetical protein